jgi:predicted ArsR family transcriptional regulator
MKLTAREAADRLGVSYVVAAGLMAHLEDVGRAKVVEKKFHSSGKGKPTRVYEVDQNTTIDFGGEAVSTGVAFIDELLASPTPPDVQNALVQLVVEDAAAKGFEVVSVDSKAFVIEKKQETPDHVAAALARLKQNNF